MAFFFGGGGGFQMVWGGFVHFLFFVGRGRYNIYIYMYYIFAVTRSQKG